MLQDINFPNYLVFKENKSSQSHKCEDINCCVFFFVIKTWQYVTSKQYLQTIFSGSAKFTYKSLKKKQTAIL